MSPVIAVRLRLCGVVLLVALVGCGSRTGAVSGKVTYKGKPVIAGAVVFYAADGNTDSGRIDPKGNYTVAQAPAGTAKVAILASRPRNAPAIPVDRTTGRPKAPPPKDGDDLIIPTAAGGKAAFPDKYNDPDTSGLTYTVKGGKQTFDIDLTD